MSISVRIKKNDLAKLAKAAPEKAEKVIRAAALDGEAYVKRSMATSPAGPTGASLPGNPPRIDIGHLVNNIVAKPAGKLHWRITSAADYSMELEYGTTYMAARPFMHPMATYLSKNMPRYFKHFLD